MLVADIVVEDAVNELAGGPSTASRKLRNFWWRWPAVQRPMTVPLLVGRIKTLLANPSLISRVDGEWDRLSEQFETTYSSIPIKYMERTELSFHPFVKLLGFLCIELTPLIGDVVEIGVWKGKSLAFMERLVQAPTKVIGIDPCELQGQKSELQYFHQTIFPECALIIGYSHFSIEKVLQSSQKFKLLHIDGGHARENVWMDFLMYERFVVPGGYIVFDDYMDHEYCPEIGPTIDKMREMGIFDQYHDIGSVPNYENSYLLIKR
jgi:SAM-dependent methyltransferase